MSFFIWQGGLRRETSVRPTTPQKYERLRDGFLAGGVRA